MKFRFILLAALALITIPVRSQFSAGYGIGFFPRGMNTHYLGIKYYQENSWYDEVYGPLTKRAMVLPFFHGFTLNWQAGEKKGKDNRINFNWSNLHNGVVSTRTDSAGNETVYKSKKRVNSLLFGLCHIMGDGSNKIESWHLNGVFTQYSGFINGRRPEEKWYRSSRDADFGFDVGLTLRAAHGSIYLHYQQTLLMFSNYNPSYIGIQYRIRLSKHKY